MRKSAIAVVIVAVALVIAGAGMYWQHESQSEKSSAMQTAARQAPKKPQGGSAEKHETPKHGRTGAPRPGATQPPAGQSGRSSSTMQASPNKPSNPAPSTARQFCNRDFSDPAAREADVSRLAKAGGLVEIFQHEAALSDPYGCAAAYLKQGLNINAADPRADSKHLTGLLFAIQRNDPKMVNFMLDHGADLQKRAGPNHIKPYGYAVFLALHNQSTNYNRVIGILDSALDKASHNTG